MSPRIKFRGTVQGFRLYALPALRKAAMQGLSLAANAGRIQRELDKAMVHGACATAGRGRIA